MQKRAAFSWFVMWCCLKSHSNKVCFQHIASLFARGICVQTHGADVNAVAEDGSTALLLAAHEGHAAAAIVLLDTGAVCSISMSLFVCCVGAVSHLATVVMW